MADNSERGTRNPELFLVMGVAGSGKSTVGRALAAAVGAGFLDADDFHPPANVAKMSRGEPLTDEDRWPWLDRMNGVLRERVGAGEDTVLACSALKQAYRDRLFDKLDGSVRVVHLRADYETLLGRMRGREHFMPPSLLASQFETLEPPANAITVDAREPVRAIVDLVLRQRAGGGGVV